MTLVLVAMLAAEAFFEPRVSFLQGGVGKAGIYIMCALFFMMFMKKTDDWSPSIMSMKKRDIRALAMGAVSGLLISGTAFRIPDGMQSLDENILFLLLLAVNAIGIEFFFRVYGAYIFGGTDFMGVNDYIFSALIYGLFTGLLSLVSAFGSGTALTLQLLGSIAISAVMGFCSGLMLMAVYARTDSLVVVVIVNVLCQIGSFFAFNSASGKGIGIAGIVLSFLGCLAALGTAANLIPGNVPRYTDHD